MATGRDFLEQHFWELGPESRENRPLDPFSQASPLLPRPKHRPLLSGCGHTRFPRLALPTVTSSPSAIPPLRARADGFLKWTMNTATPFPYSHPVLHPSFPAHNPSPAQALLSLQTVRTVPRLWPPTPVGPSGPAVGSIHMAVILSGVLALAVPLMRDVSLVLPSSGPEILSSHSPAPPHSIGSGLLEALLCFTAARCSPQMQGLCHTWPPLLKAHGRCFVTDWVSWPSMPGPVQGGQSGPQRKEEATSPFLSLCKPMPGS